MKRDLFQLQPGCCHLSDSELATTWTAASNWLDGIQMGPTSNAARMLMPRKHDLSTLAQGAKRLVYILKMLNGLSASSSRTSIKKLHPPSLFKYIHFLPVPGAEPAVVVTSTSMSR